MTRVMADSNPDPSAHQVFEVLVRDHADHLLVFLRAVVRDKSAVDDIFQETMMVAWRRLNDFDRTRSFGAWIRGIGARIAMDHAGKKRAQPMDPAMLEDLERHAAAFDGDHASAFRNRLLTLDECLSRLPAEAADVLRLVYQANLSLKHVAAQLSLNEEAVKKRVQRARALLGECLHQKGLLA